jgi:hypothetical protein
MKSSIKLSKVTFKQMPLELEKEMFFDFLEGDWSRIITDKYPKFLRIKVIKSKKNKQLEIKNEIISIRAELREKMDQALESIKINWQIVEKNVSSSLSSILQEDWLNKEITAYISLNPICPRYLDSWSFSLTYDRYDTNSIITHEISHFLYFKKFKKMFPDIKNNNYESPHKEWLLSELVAVTILNDQRIKNILNKGESDYYPEHKKLMLNGELLTEIIEKLYKEYVISKNDFSEFIKKGFAVVNMLK